jgi:H/ACA ribonucleoprotein complex subunit 3
LNRIMRKCKNCGSYTLGEKCLKCGSVEIASPHPPKFSPDDKYLRYRVPQRYSQSVTVATPLSTGNGTIRGAAAKQEKKESR